ncbi:MAG: shikimate kinase [Desulfobacterales bacterium]|nr:shikimate kinase [Desulfobacterales bacterium]
MFGSKTNIILTGMPAVGKSTVGVLLAKRLGMAFVDTDILIQTVEQKSLQVLIKTNGLEQFCDLEERHILVMNYTDTVIATGGSVVYRAAAMRHLAAGGTVVYLEIDLENLENRLSDIDARGVVYSPGQSLADLYLERLPLYQKTADMVVRASGVTPDQLVSKIIEQLNATR